MSESWRDAFCTYDAATGTLKPPKSPLKYEPPAQQNDTAEAMTLAVVNRLVTAVNSGVNASRTTNEWIHGVGVDVGNAIEGLGEGIVQALLDNSDGLAQLARTLGKAFREGMEDRNG